MSDKLSVEFIYTRQMDGDGSIGLVGHGFIVDGHDRINKFNLAVSAYNRGHLKLIWMKNADGSEEAINMPRVESIRIKELK